MDTDLAQHLMDLKEGLGRIDERTIMIHKNQEDLGDALVKHEDRDRIDFEKVHVRIGKNDKKLNYILGWIGLASFLVVAVMTFFTSAS